MKAQFFSKKTHNLVIEVERFPTTFIYWLYPESDRFPSLKDMSNSDELDENSGYGLINKLNNNKSLYKN